MITNEVIHFFQVMQAENRKLYYWINDIKLPKRVNEKVDDAVQVEPLPPDILNDPDLFPTEEEEEDMGIFEIDKQVKDLVTLDEPVHLHEHITLEDLVWFENLGTIDEEEEQILLT